MDSEGGKHSPMQLLLTEVDSAVDLEYYSQCGTPTDLPPGFDRSHIVQTSLLHSDNVQQDCTDEDRLKAIKRDYSCAVLIPRNTGEQSNQQLLTAIANERDDQPESSSTGSTPLSSSYTVQTVALCLKLPDGGRIQVELPLNYTIKQVMEHAEMHSNTDLKNCEISTNEIPRRVFTNESLTLYDAGITVRTVLHFSQ